MTKNDLDRAPAARLHLARRIGIPFACAAAALAACGGGGGGHHHGPTVLFEERFDGAFPGSAWEVVQPSAAIHTGSGQPAPSVVLLAGPDQPWIQHRPSPEWSWAWSGGIEMFVFALFPEGADSGAAEIDVLDLNSVAPGIDGTLARVDASGSTATGVDLAYSVLTQHGWVQTSESLPPGDGWHDYAFEVRSDGTASWYRDGTEKLATDPWVLYDADLGLGLRSFFGMDAQFDEVLVRRP